MKQLLIALLLITSFASCKKDEVKPETGDLIGVWYSSEPEFQFTINNTTGQGSVITFEDYIEGGIRYLKANFPEKNYTFIIKSVTSTELILIDTEDPAKAEIKFKKSK